MTLEIEAAIHAARAEEAAKRANKGKPGPATKSIANSATATNATGKDVDAQRATLRGFAIQGWETAIKKVLTNAGTYAKRAKNEAVPATASMPLTDAMRLLNLLEFTPRMKFVTDMHDEILAHSRTYPGGNAGANFNHAAKEMWARADQSHWAAETRKDMEAVPISELIAMFKNGLCSALSTILGTGRLGHFVATLQLGYHDAAKDQMVFEVGEVLPPDSGIQREFHEMFSTESGAQLRAMHQWAAETLRDLSQDKNAAADNHERLGAPQLPLFTLSDSQLESLTVAELTTEITAFLNASFAFSHEAVTIPWDDIRANPAHYYDTDMVKLPFPLDDPSRLKPSQRFDIATALRDLTGPLFRKPGDSDADQLNDNNSEAAISRERAEADHLAAAAAEAARIEAQRIASEKAETARIAAVEREKADREKAEREQTEREQAEREQAEREEADRKAAEAVEKEKADAAQKLVDYEAAVAEARKRRQKIPPRPEGLPEPDLSDAITKPRPRRKRVHDEVEAEVPASRILRSHKEAADKRPTKRRR
ncbi:hypothetical protein MIND_00212300 [Mycena indigotica]|uniref:Uncharacterized protein n=1 Tax=Mycena indigotica TaxID=2126181 RepID=A0A8H6T740_9AGAR|nr:uncharacterized protein MIND_00212300 [Mycena indigotica]KAF7312004.1 hypothetical protein MIND_00212300 [Mycena indigotica]